MPLFPSHGSPIGCCRPNVLSRIKPWAGILLGQQIERVSQKHHEPARLALKGADIPEQPHQRTRKVYHWEFASRALGPIRHYQ